MIKTIVIYNRHALKRKPRHSIEEVGKALLSAGIDHVMISPMKSGETIELVEAAVRDGTERVICTGGDGTVNEVVNGVVRAEKNGAARAAIGILPNGRGNDFGYAVGIPQDLQRSIAIIAAGHLKKVDVGRVYDGLCERYFMNGAGVGIDAAINYWATLSSLNGFPSYAWGLLKALSRNYVQPVMRIRIDGESFEKPVVMLAAMNGLREGGGFQLAPDFDLQDGLLNVSIIGDGLPLWRVLPIIPSFFNGTVAQQKIVHRYLARRIEVEVLDCGLIGQADGEVLGTELRSFRAEIAGDSIDLIVPEAG